jgi:tetratricopeptide (TPR) repeat protein
MKTMAIVVPMALSFALSTRVVLAAPLQSAQADNRALLEKARANFHQGVQLFNEGSFEAALAEFHKAYQLGPSYRVLYNIAQTYFELHDYVSAQRFLKQYVQEGGSEIAAARRAEVDELSRKLDERIAQLEIVASVDGADIRVDDISVGTSPLAAPVRVNAGPRRVSAVKPGYAVASRAVTVAGTEKAKVTLEIAELGPNPPAEQSATVTLPKTVVETASPVRASHTGLTVSLVATASCAVATGVLGWLALKSKKDFESELDKIPNTRDRVDSARNKTKNYAYLTDALGAATVISGGVALYFALTGSTDSASRQSSIAWSPTVGGMVLHGAW